MWVVGYEVVGNWLCCGIEFMCLGCVLGVWSS